MENIDKINNIVPDERDDDEYNLGSLKFIWGVASSDNLVGADANFHTLNDIDIIYEGETKKYLLSIEIAYNFENKESEQEYISRCFDAFTNFMADNDYDVNYEYFGPLKNIGFEMEADSIPELYAKLKILLFGFLNF